MEHISSIILIKKDNKYLDYYDERLNMYLFLNMKENDKENILNSKLVYNNNNLLMKLMCVNLKIRIDNYKIYLFYVILK